jgi:phytoene synthase
LGIALSIVSHIQELRSAIEQDRVYFPLEAFAQVGLEPSSLKELKQTTALTQLLQEKANKAREHYQAALAKLPAQEMKGQQHNLVYGALRMALLDTIEKDGFHVLDYRLELTPLQNYWLSQKKRREIRKNSRLKAAINHL